MPGAAAAGLRGWWPHMTRNAPQFDEGHARRWHDIDAAESYRHRAPYPPETFDILRELIADEPRRVLDIGCGTGDIARPLAPFAGSIEAVDFSPEMVAVGRSLPGGTHPSISWTVSRGEEYALRPPYALIAAGQSLHWMDTELLLPRFASALTANGMLAVVNTVAVDERPWDEPIREIAKRHSTWKEYVPFDMIPFWQERGLFELRGERRTAPVEFVQTVEECIAGFHGLSHLTRAHIDAPAFDAEVRNVLQAHCQDGVVRRQIAGNVLWGKPLAGLGAQ